VLPNLRIRDYSRSRPGLPPSKPLDPSSHVVRCLCPPVPSHQVRHDSLIGRTRTTYDPTVPQDLKKVRPEGPSLPCANRGSTRIEPLCVPLLVSNFTLRQEYSHSNKLHRLCEAAGANLAGIAVEPELEQYLIDFRPTRSL